MAYHFIDKQMKINLIKKHLIIFRLGKMIK